MREQKNLIRADKGEHSFSLIGYFFMAMVSLICLIPFWLIVSGSLSSEQSVVRYGFSLLPRDFCFDAYRSIFSSWERILRSYLVTIGITVLGTGLSLMLTSMGGYVLQRQDFPYRNKLSFFVYFTTLFSGGLIPTYILMVTYLNMKNTYLALILPSLLTPWYLMLMRNFIKSIPFSIVEAAKIDGAGDWKIFWQMILPLSKAGLATVGLFIALGYWNNWYFASLYITREEMYPLQYLLYQLLSSAEYLKKAAASGVATGVIQTPSETLKMATAVVVTGPIILLYPFVQKYFVKGVMIGSVKG